MPEKYILLEDVVAYKPSIKWDILSAKSFVEEHLLRGSLLVDLTESEAKQTGQYFAVPLNYKKYSDDSVKLHCRPEQVLQLNDEQFNLLWGVKYPSDRYKALNILHWVEKLMVGYCVNVAIPTIPHPVRGIIRYKGPVPIEEGTKFGIELLERRGEGTSDGTYKNTEYFKCGHDCAMFVAMDKLSEPGDTHPPQVQDAPLKLGDEVTFFDQNDKPSNGIVRWIGMNKDVLRNGAKIVGIETEHQVSSGLVPGALARMNHLFILRNSKGVKLFLPIDSVLKVDKSPPAASKASSHPYNTRDEQGVCPMATVNLIQHYSKEKGQSEMQFMSEQLQHQLNYEHKKQQEEATKRQENQSGSPVKDFDVDKVNVDEQKRLYEELQRASKQGSEGQKHQIKHNMDAHSGGLNSSQQRGERCYQPPAIQHNQQDAVQNPPASKDKWLSISNKDYEDASRPHHDLTNLENQVKQLQIDNDSHDNQLTAFNTTVGKLHRSVNEIEEEQKVGMQKSTERIAVLEKAFVEIQASNEQLRNQLSLTQQQLSNVQKSNEALQTHLQNQLSLTQQQLLGVQSMITCSRLWVVSHDQFTLGKEIGRGSWASVHETRYRGANIAAKRLHDKITYPETREVLQQEMEMALHCQHQNIVTFLGATLEGHPVILMELMDINLRSAYDEGVVKDHQKVGIFSDIASALHFLHTRPDPVIHRDVSSANVLLKSCGNQRWLAKLGDLGTAKVQQQTTTPGPGAIAYAAPEVVSPAQHSTKMDVYSFGVLIIETLMKTHPFNKVNILKSQVQCQFPQYHQLVTSCTNQRPSDRPKMYDVIVQLDSIKTAKP